MKNYPLKNAWRSNKYASESKLRFGNPWGYIIVINMTNWFHVLTIQTKGEKEEQFSKKHFLIPLW